MRSESKWWAAALTAALSAAPSAARAEGPAKPAAPAAAPRDAAEAPGNGSATGIAGSVFAVGGAASLLVLPFCTTLDGTQNGSRQCLIAAGTTTALFLAVGLPLLAVSEGQAKAFKAWQAAHPGVAGLGLSTGGGGGMLTWSARF